MDTNRFPLDFDAIKPGHVISAETVERFRVLKMPNSELWVARLGLRDLIEAELEKRGQVLVVRCEGETLVVLDVEQSDAYLDAEHHRSIRRAVRKALIQQRLDVSRMTEAGASIHERRINNNSRTLLALMAERPQLKLVAHRRALERNSNGIRDDHREDSGRQPAPDAQRPTGEPVEPARQGDEGNHQEA